MNRVCHVEISNCSSTNLATRLVLRASVERLGRGILVYAQVATCHTVSLLSQISKIYMYSSEADAFVSVLEPRRQRATCASNQTG